MKIPFSGAEGLILDRQVGPGDPALTGHLSRIASTQCKKSDQTGFLQYRNRACSAFGKDIVYIG